MRLPLRLCSQGWPWPCPPGPLAPQMQGFATIAPGAAWPSAWPVRAAAAAARPRPRWLPLSNRGSQTPPTRPCRLLLCSPTSCSPSPTSCSPSPSPFSPIPSPFSPSPSPPTSTSSSASSPRPSARDSSAPPRDPLPLRCTPLPRLATFLGREVMPAANGTSTYPNPVLRPFIRRCRLSQCVLSSTLPPLWRSLPQATHPEVPCLFSSRPMRASGFQSLPCLSHSPSSSPLIAGPPAPFAMGGSPQCHTFHARCYSLRAPHSLACCPRCANELRHH